MKKFNRSFSLLAIGKTQESAEGGNGFKRYVGLASSKILAFNPTKEKLDELLGYETKEEPEYFGEDKDGKFAKLTFVFQVDPDTNNGIDAVQYATIWMRMEPAYNTDKSSVQVIDQYGNFTWANSEIAQAGGKIEHAQKLDKYRMACVGECALVDFLKKYLNVPDAYDYKNGVWVKKENGKSEEGIFGLEHIKDYFKGDFKEIKEAIALQPTNKIKLLWGVQEDNGKQYQTILLREQLMLNNASGIKGLTRLEKDLANAKEHTTSDSKFARTVYQVCELKEYNVEPTNLESPISEDSGSSSELPWEA